MVRDIGIQKAVLIQFSLSYTSMETTANDSCVTARLFAFMFRLPGSYLIFKSNTH